MAKTTVFRDFVKALRNRWQIDLPEIRQVETSLGQGLPKASTFYAGHSQQISMHVFLHFQHSVMAWQIGRFTVNLVLSQQEVAVSCGGAFLPKPGVPLTEGSYRIGHLIGGKDKWWRLKERSSEYFDADLAFSPSQFIDNDWQPTTYDDSQIVIKEAVVSVTQDVRSVLVRLGVMLGDHPDINAST